jgi:glycosyltransferase involved in cell wall biosynthesis
VVLFQHSDCIPFKMEFIYFPKLKGTMFEKWLMKKYNYTVQQTDKFAFITKIGMDNFHGLHPQINLSSSKLILNGINDYNAEENGVIKNFEFSKSFKYELVVVGTVSQRKGQGIIIDALTRLDNNVLGNIHLTIIGNGPDKERLINLVDNSNIQQHVTFLGNVDNQDIFKKLLGKDIFVLMSENEGLPISIIEAMRSSLPIITTKNSGMPEIVKDGYNGVLLDRSSEQLIKILSNLESYNWDIMGRNSRRRFENDLTFDRMKKEYCDMLDSIL